MIALPVQGCLGEVARKVALDLGLLNQIIKKTGDHLVELRINKLRINKEEEFCKISAARLRSTSIPPTLTKSVMGTVWKMTILLLKAR